MKLIRRLVLGVILLIIVAVAVVYLSLDHIIKTAVETQATRQLSLQTTLKSASLSLTGGKLTLTDLQIASPAGYSAPEMLSLGSGAVHVSYSALRGNPVHVASILLDQPTLVIENVNGTLNFKKAADDMPKGEPAPAPSQSSSESKPPLKLIIDDLTIQNAKVIIRPGLPGVPQELTVPVATFDMKNIGTGDGAQNGSAVKDVVMQVITALAGHASESSMLPAGLQGLLKGNVAATLTQLGGEAQKRVLQALPGDLGKTIGGAIADPNALIKNPTSILNHVTGAGAGPTSNPASLIPKNLVPSNATDAIHGLLGGNKHKGNE